MNKGYILIQNMHKEYIWVNMNKNIYKLWIQNMNKKYGYRIRTKNAYMDTEPKNVYMNTEHNLRMYIWTQNVT